MTGIAALKTVLSGHHLLRALAATAIVGTVLNLINQGDALFSNTPIDIAKLVFTYVVPFFVTTYGAWSSVVETKR